jgi:hypothetical protein
MGRVWLPKFLPESWPEFYQVYSGYIFFLAGGPISWSCKRQPVIATSFTEAEYIGQYNAARKVIWI